MSIIKIFIILYYSLSQFGKTNVSPTEVSGRTFYRVRIGPFNFKEEAEGAREQGFTAFYLDRSGENNEEWTIHNLKQLIGFIEG